MDTLIAKMCGTPMTDSIVLKNPMTFKSGLQLASGHGQILSGTFHKKLEDFFTFFMSLQLQVLQSPKTFLF